MKTCQGCGGVLGRDCWNESDCIQISQSMNSGNDQFINQIQHELAWERQVVVPDLERKIATLIDILETHGIDIPDLNNHSSPCDIEDLPF